MYSEEDMIEMFMAGAAWGAEGHDFATDEEAAKIALGVISSAAQQGVEPTVEYVAGLLAGFYATKKESPK